MRQNILHFYYDYVESAIYDELEIDIYQNYKDNFELNYDFCELWYRKFNGTNIPLNCSEHNQEVDCTLRPYFQRLGCYDFTGTYFESPFGDKEISRLKIPFPMDSTPKDIPNYGACENGEFFREFNGADELTDSVKTTLTIYSPKFDLSNLPKHTTPSVTKHVILQADSVFMSEPLEITYDLTIIARIVSISEPIAMIYEGREMSIENMKIKDVKEKLIIHDEKLIMQWKSFGRMNVLQSWNDGKCFGLDKLTI